MVYYPFLLWPLLVCALFASIFAFLVQTAMQRHITPANTALIFCLEPVFAAAYAYLAAGRWFRQTTANGNFSLGAQRYNARMAFAMQSLEITFDRFSHEFVCLPERPPQTFRVAAQGLTKEALMGELDPLISVEAYQLALPFTRQAWREILLCQDLTGTTL